MTGSVQKLVLTVPAAELAAFLEAIKKFEAVKVERLEEIIARYVQAAPKKPAFSDDEIADILMEFRYGKTAEA